jgi:hypothetical protein
MPRETNRYIEALKDEPHLIGMAAIFAVCAATAPLVFPFVALPLEAAYLLFVPDSAWFRNRMRRKYDADVERRRRELRDRLLPALSPQDQARFIALEEARAEIAGQERSAPGAWSQEVLRQLDYLIEKFLMFASKKMEYRRYIVELAVTRAELEGRRLRLPRQPGDEYHPERVVERAAREADVDMLLAGVLGDYGAEIQNLDGSIQQEKDAQTREILKTNQEILRRSRESAAEIGRLLRNLDQQLQLVVNTFSLINSQVRTSSPEQLLGDVNSVVDQSESLTEALAAFSPVDQTVQRLDRAG